MRLIGRCMVRKTFMVVVRLLGSRWCGSRREVVDTVEVVVVVVEVVVMKVVLNCLMTVRAGLL